MPRGFLFSLAIHAALLALAVRGTPLELGARTGERMSVIGSLEPAKSAAPLPPVARASSASAPLAPARASSAPSLPGGGTGAAKPRGAPADMALTIQPRYPRASRALGEEGTVLIQARISPEGGVSDVQLVKSSGYRRLDEAALEAARAATASFAVHPQTPIEKELSVVFRLSDPD